MSIEAMKLMVEAIEADLKLFNIPMTARMLEALDAGRQAIAEAEKQEPVAWMRKLFSPELGEFFDYKDGAFANETDSEGWTPLYTSPPQRQWVGLTDEDVYPLANEHLRYQPEDYEVSGVYDLARAIEAKLKEKNT